MHAQGQLPDKTDAGSQILYMDVHNSCLCKLLLNWGTTSNIEARWMPGAATKSLSARPIAQCPTLWQTGFIYQRIVRNAENR